MPEVDAVCPQCEKSDRMNYDTWEDCFICQRCYLFWYPSEVGRADNPHAGIWHIGEQHTQSVDDID